MRETLHPDEREEAQVAGALRQLAAETRPPHPLPTAGQLWWRAEVVRRLVRKPDEEADRALRPAVWGGMAGVVFGLAMLLSFLSRWSTDLLEPLGRRVALGDPLPVALAGLLLPLAAGLLLALLLARRT
ncbi:MAG TPA: hypothetical protein VKK31_30620 [Thermoanaerobaculia bacterium]|nr:hypothetical protein [Thermoanaerobaculia bacterium]